MRAERAEWANAYARQARCDWRMFELLLGQDNVPVAQVLHYLQMSSEKIAKSYRLTASTLTLEELRATHVIFAKAFSTWLDSPFGQPLLGRLHDIKAAKQVYRLLARETELLAPSSDASSTPQNVEYPWEARDDAGRPVVRVPCDERFAIERVLDPQDRVGFHFLKLLREMITRPE